MGYGSIAGRARANPSSPRAFALCDRCGIWYNHVDLQWQFDWRGASLTNLRLLVCRPCYDDPQEQLRAIVVPADPVPILNPRIEYFVSDETNIFVTSGPPPFSSNLIVGMEIPPDPPSTFITQNGNQYVGQMTGEPPGGLNEQPGTDPFVPDAMGGDNPGVPYEFENVPPETTTDIPETGPLYGE